MADELKVVEAKVVAEAEALVPSKASWIAQHATLVFVVVAVVAVGLVWHILF